MTEKFIPFQQEEMDNPGDICCDYGDDAGSCSDRFITGSEGGAGRIAGLYLEKCCY